MLPEYDLDDVEIVEMKEYSEEFDGDKKVKIGYDDSGERFYIKDGDQEETEYEKNLASSIILEELEIEVPDYGLNRDEQQVIYEEIDGESINPYMEELDESDIDRDSYIEALIGREILGDSDYGENIIVNEEGESVNIDFDLTANTIDFNGAQGVSYMLDDFANTEFDINGQEIEEKKHEIAERIQLGSIFGRLDSEPVLDGFDQLDVYKDNLEKFINIYGPNAPIHSLKPELCASD